jgi:spermidine synthase
MLPWILLDSAIVPGDGGEMRLYRRGDEFSIRIGNYELMNSRSHSSEEALASVVLQRVATRSPRVLVGGLGMGFTTRAVLKAIGAEGRVTVAEIVPEVVKWNREHIGDLATHPLADSRVTVVERDVAAVIAAEAAAFDAILLDVDNGPAGLTASANDRLYSLDGLRSVHRALRTDGFLGVWSSGDDPAFTRRLEKAGFQSEQVRIRGRGSAGGSRYIIWVAQQV